MKLNVELNVTTPDERQEAAESLIRLARALTNVEGVFEQQPAPGADETGNGEAPPATKKKVIRKKKVAAKKEKTMTQAREKLGELVAAKTGSAASQLLREHFPDSVGDDGIARVSGVKPEDYDRLFELVDAALADT